MDRLEEFRLNGAQDKFIWLLDKSKNYCTRSTYRRLTFRGILKKSMAKLWKSKLPYKLKFFSGWLSKTGYRHESILRRETAGAVGITVASVVYLKLWTISFFHCYIARVIWFCFKEALGWDRVPKNMQDIFDHWIILGERTIMSNYIHVYYCSVGTLECSEQNGDRKQVPKFI